jgi:hypothetical protein
MSLKIKYLSFVYGVNIILNKEAIPGMEGGG